jgi:hypothetical protein
VNIKAEITSDGQVTIKKYQSYITSITCKSNLILLIRYPFFIVMVPLQLLVNDILNITMELQITTKVTRYVAERLLRYFEDQEELLL